MGGRSDVQNEVLCRFVFPERPGALMKFLDVFSPRWNISLFHYRGQVSIQHVYKFLYLNGVVIYGFICVLVIFK